VFQLEAVRFILEQCRKPLPTFGSRFHRTPRHLPRMARELPCEWRQRVAANKQAAAPPLSRNWPAGVASVSGKEGEMVMPRVKRMLTVFDSWWYAALSLVLS
jgi:hypothetical protein